MKIERKPLEKNYVNFEVLKDADVFRYAGAYYIKIEEIIYYNAINLENGLREEFNSFDKVIKLDTKLIIE